MAHVLQVTRVRSGKRTLLLFHCECSLPFALVSLRTLLRQSRLPTARPRRLDRILERHAIHVSVQSTGGLWKKFPLRDCTPK